VAYGWWVILEVALDGGLLVFGRGEVVPVGIKSVKLVFNDHNKDNVRETTTWSEVGTGALFDVSNLFRVLRSDAGIRLEHGRTNSSDVGAVDGEADSEAARITIGESSTIGVETRSYTRVAGRVQEGCSCQSQLGILVALTLLVRKSELVFGGVAVGC